MKGRLFKQAVAWAGSFIGVTLSGVGCFSSADTSAVLPASSTAPAVRGYQTARVVTHYHSPYSWDACDRNGTPGGAINQGCLADFRFALCQNHVDMAFVTDHPSNMANYEMKDLLLIKSGDNLILKNGLPYVNSMGGCADGFRPLLAVGFEDRLLPVGMTQHLDPDPATRLALYTTETLALSNQLKTQSEAVVVIPHTESRTVSEIEGLNPDAIEIYNLHANIDPKIRLHSLGLAPFSFMPSLLTYIVDPYGQLNPDLAFLGFFQIAQVYFQTWNQLISDGFPVAGLAGTDSHENVFPQTVADGERLDSHRRIIRTFSNHVKVKSIDPDSIKEALQAGRLSIQIEGLGVVDQFDFYGTAGSSTAEMGETLSLSQGLTTLYVQSPTLAVASAASANDPPSSGQVVVPFTAPTQLPTLSPLIRVELRQVLTGGKDQVVASSNGTDISFNVTQPGAYRVQAFITPLQLKVLLGPLSDQANKEYPWIVTNHIYITP